MKRNILFTIFTLGISSLFAQTQDSVTMGAGSPSYPYDVYYNLTTHQKDTFLNTNWHLAFALRPAVPPSQTMQSTTVRINASRSVILYNTGKTVADWNTTTDTAGFSTWTSMSNDNHTWDVGAFNADRDTTNPFDYGWGEYDMGSHNVIGDKMHVLAIGTAPKVFKKINIKTIIYDSLWIFTIANIDGTDSVTEMITKGGHGQQLFMYYNALTKEKLIREPNHPWDLLFTSYREIAVIPPYPAMPFNFMGVLQAPQLMTARVQGIPTLAADTANATNFSKNISTIGWDWKKAYAGAPANPWELIDSLCYFIKRDGDSVEFKLWFTSFASNPNNIVFNTIQYELPVIHIGLNKVEPSLGNLSVYPNPASTSINVVLNHSKVSKAQVEVMDITGKVIMHTSMDASMQTTVQVSHLQKGIYFIRVSTNDETTTQKFVIN